MSSKSVVKAVRVLSTILASVYGESEKPVSLRLAGGTLISFCVSTTKAAEVNRFVESKLAFIFGEKATSWSRLVKTEQPVWSVRTENVNGACLVQIWFNIPA
jgi:hypothetical protein